MAASRSAGQRLRRRVLVRLPLFLLVLVALVVAARQGGTVLGRAGHPHTLRVGAGHPNDDAATIATALADLAREEAAPFSLEVVETDGTIDNVARLNRGELELATVQSDTALPTGLQLVAVLYHDAYLLVVPADSPVAHIRELAGGTIATAEAGSAQELSLRRVLAHYHLQDSVRILHTDTPSTEGWLADGRADALFRVRSVHNHDLRAVAATRPLRLLPIGQAGAFEATDPSTRATRIPRGVLDGWPPLPAVDTPTVQVDRLLVARSDVPAATIRAVARLLFDHRQALVRRTPIAAGTTPPTRSVNNPAPLHPGVEAWLDRAEPSYLEKNADYVSLLMSTVLLLGSWAWAGRSYVARRMQRRADHHHHVLLDILLTIDDAPNLRTLEEQNTRLLKILEEVLDDVETGSISPAHFQGFALGWEAAHRTLADRLRAPRAAAFALENKNTDPG